MSVYGILNASNISIVFNLTGSYVTNENGCVEMVSGEGADGNSSAHLTAGNASHPSPFPATSSSSLLCTVVPDQGYVTAPEILIIVFLSGFILSIIIGNIFVILSVILFREMRTLTNGLIVSLASADLLVAIIVLPISLYNEILGTWSLGNYVCDFWITSDVFCCTASILNIVAIALDRYWLITLNVRYTHNATLPRQRVCAFMALLAWAASGIISSSPLLGWKRGDEHADPSICMISQDIGYTVFSTFGAFWLPLIVILIVYFKIFKIARRRAMSRAKARAVHPSVNSTVMSEMNGTLKAAANRRYSCRPSRSDSPSPPLSPERTVNMLNGSSNVGEGDDTGGVARDTPDVCVGTASLALPSNLPPPTPPPGQRRQSQQYLTPQRASLQLPLERRKSSLRAPTETDMDADCPTPLTSAVDRKRRRRRSKAQPRCRYRGRLRSSARTLGLIIGGFVLCWLPFFILATVVPFCTVCAPPPIVNSVTLWLGYSNSLLNPAIYAIWDKNFRRSFKRLITCDIRCDYIL